MRRKWSPPRVAEAGVPKESGIGVGGTGGVGRRWGGGADPGEGEVLRGRPWVGAVLAGARSRSAAGGPRRMLGRSTFP